MENNHENQGININSLNTEGLSKASKHVDRKGSSKFSWKVILIVSLLLGGTVVGLATGIPAYRNNYVVPNVPFALVDSIDQNKQSTFLDEVLNDQSSKVAEGHLSLLEEVQQLELYLNMVNDLDELNLESYTKTVIPATQDENFDKNLKEKYSRFLNIISQDNFKKDVLSQESLEVHTLAAELNGYKEAVESKITTHGYEIVAEFGIYAAKTEVIDASGISYMNISNLTIPASMKNNDYHIIYTDPTTSKEYRIEVPANSIVHKLIDSIYYAQVSSRKNVVDGQSVNSENLTTAQIVEDLNRILNEIKVSMYVSHTNDGTLKPIVGYNDVRQMVSIPEEETVATK